MTDRASKKPLPARSKRAEVGIIATKAVTSAVPFVGGPVAELIDLLQAPLQKRQHEWWADLAERVVELEDDGRLRREGLAENESFLNAAARAASAVLRTGQREKREALRNAVLNVALDLSLDEAEQDMFLELVERFGVWHLRVLKAFENPAEWARTHQVNYHPGMSSSRGDYLEAAFPELANRKTFYGRVWADLTQAGLVSSALVVMMTERGWESAATTELGVRFLRFVEEPPEAARA